MKNGLLILLGMLSLISCSKNKTDKNLHIIGNIKGLREGTLYIKKRNDSSFVTLDSIKIHGDSNFKSDLKIQSPEMYYLFLDRGRTNSIDNSLPFFAEAGTIKIQTSLEKFLFDARISGSKNHDLYSEYKGVASRFNDENLDLTAKKIDAIRFKRASTLDSINIKQEQILKRRYLYSVNFALNHRDFEVAPFIALNEIYDVNLKYLDTIQKAMTPKVAQSLYGKQLTNFLNERKKEGQK